VIRLLIVDDQELVRTGFRVVLDAEPDFEVVGESADGLAALEAAKELRPDVVLMDIRMPNLDGIEATRRIAATDAAPRILILTTFDLDDYVYEALHAGASGFLLKDARGEELCAAVRTVAAGEALLSPAITRKLIESYTRRPPPSAHPTAFGELTPRELEVLRLVARGMSNNDIARELVVGDATVKTHVARIFSKLDLHDRAQAVVLAYESGLIQAGENRPARRSET
jgi:DNA-binding NarL/FixJ family response regulator